MGVTVTRLSSYHTLVAKRALCIINPAARGAPATEQLRDAIGELDAWEISLEATARPGDATELARRAAQDRADAVIACGGDGTLNEIANGLVNSHTALAVVRGGTANVWAKEVRIPSDPATAVRLLNDGDTRTIDLGRAGERYFLLMAGIGFDAAIVRGVSATLKRRLGAASYLLHGMSRALTHRATAVDLVVNGERRADRLYWLLLGNTRSYAGVLNITHQAEADDGRLDLCLLREGGPLRLGWLSPWVLLGRHHQRAGVTYEKVDSLEVRTPGLPVQVDGEYLCETPLRFETAPAALRVIVPRGLRSPLFGAGGPGEVR